MVQEQLLNSNRLASAELPGYSHNFTGLRTRLLLGGAALDKNTNLPSLTVNTVASFENRDYQAYDDASTRERQLRHGVARDQIEAAADRWANDNLAVFTQDFSQTGLAAADSQKWTAASGRIGKVVFGKDRAALNARDIRAMYDHYFTGKDKNSNLKQFVADILTAYTVRDPSGAATVDYARLRGDLDIIQWYAAILGTDSQVIAAQLSDAEAHFKTQPQQVADEANNNNRQNNLLDEEKYYLDFVRGRPTTRPRPTPQPTATANPPVNNSPLPAQENQPPGPESLNTRFQKVVGPVIANHIFYVDNPPARITLSPDELKELELTESFFINTKELPDGGIDAQANPRVVPHVYAIGDSSAQPLPRFMNGEQSTDGDSGLFALAAASSPIPEKQAQLYRQLADVVLRVHRHNPNLIKAWLDAQDHTGILLFITFDQQRYVKSSNPEEVLLPVKPPEQLENINDMRAAVDDDVTNPLWQTRLQNLEQALQQPNPALTLAQIRQIEFLSHSVDIKKLIDKIKADASSTINVPPSPKGKPPSTLLSLPSNERFQQLSTENLRAATAFCANLRKRIKNQGIEQPENATAKKYTDAQTGIYLSAPNRDAIENVYFTINGFSDWAERNGYLTLSG
ncbi:hypothetical protein HY214_03770 [Candidatus Roizmanbacteria bacterium]|nr:hypothetical protein [Candidatus Roizmanbacteria bacterium]